MSTLSKSTIQISHLRCRKVLGAALGWGWVAVFLAQGGPAVSTDPFRQGDTETVIVPE